MRRHYKEWTSFFDDLIRKDRKEKTQSLFEALALSERIDKMANPLRILVPIKRVVDYSVGRFPVCSAPISASH